MIELSWCLAEDAFMWSAVWCGDHLGQMLSVFDNVLNY